MRRNPIFVFKNLMAVGIDKVPTRAMIQILDSDGIGTPKVIQLLNKDGVDQNTTVADFLLNHPDSYMSASEIDGGTF
jgi:hypothetical protein